MLNLETGATERRSLCFLTHRRGSGVSLLCLRAWIKTRLRRCLWATGANAECLLPFSLFPNELVAHLIQLFGPFPSRPLISQLSQASVLKHVVLGFPRYDSLSLSFFRCWGIFAEHFANDTMQYRSKNVCKKVLCTQIITSSCSVYRISSVLLLRSRAGGVIGSAHKRIKGCSLPVQNQSSQLMKLIYHSWQRAIMQKPKTTTSNKTKHPNDFNPDLRPGFPPAGIRTQRHQIIVQMILKCLYQSKTKSTSGSMFSSPSGNSFYHHSPNSLNSSYKHPQLWLSPLTPNWSQTCLFKIKASKK